jgi:hypothetical protein
MACAAREGNRPPSAKALPSRSFYIGAAGLPSALLPRSSSTRTFVPKGRSSDNHWPRRLKLFVFSAFLPDSCASRQVVRFEIMLRLPYSLLFCMAAF